MRNNKQVCRLTIVGSLICWGKHLTATCWISRLQHVNWLLCGTEAGLRGGLALRNPEKNEDCFFFFLESEKQMLCPSGINLVTALHLSDFLNDINMLHWVIWHYNYFHTHYKDMCMYKCKKKQKKTVKCFRNRLKTVQDPLCYECNAWPSHSNPPAVTDV